MVETRVTIPRLGHQQRKHQLEDYYAVLTNKAIALRCGVHESTIDRDIAKWKASGDYDEWLDRRWHQYLESDTVDDRTKFLALTRLKEKRLIRRSETRQSMEVNVRHDITSLLEEYTIRFESRPVETPPLQNHDPAQ